MCGRFSLATDIGLLQEQFDFDFNDGLNLRYNIAPSQNILVLGSNGNRRVGTTMKWGLVPSWANDTKIGYKMINARGETIDEKASFKNSFRSKRCLVLSDGFYEWKKDEKGKQPYRFVMKDRKPFVMAGLWERWDKGETPLFTCTVITTTPNDITKNVHDRMPVILPEDKYDTWINREMNDTNYLKSLLVPYPAEEMVLFQVSTLVNSPKNDVEACLEPINSL
ncbi:SOS response-associated peptidase [Metabacillus herbersteinensis]|uniref:Abasic site processing protein n=1 Tax=Metabacillus herbersteinensis TaxID=283816 RepID=A0ABV6GLU1_9BACI